MTFRTLALALGVTLVAPAAFADLSELDTNGDGMITFDEMLAAVPTVTEENFLAIDTNGDGTVDADEYAAAEAAGTLPMQDG